MNTGSREKIFSKIAPYSSKTSISYLLDLIFSCIFRLNYDHYINEKINRDKLFDHRHPYKVPSMIKRLFEQPFKFQQFVRPLFLIEHHILSQ